MSLLTTLEEYMHERYRIFLKKESGLPRPWTEDTILSEYKFTNVFRSDDRTTRALKQHFYCHGAGRPLGELLGNAAVARYFGVAEFAIAVGWQKVFDRRRLLDIARSRKAAGLRNFTGAYMVTNANRTGPKEEVVTDFIEGLWENAPRIASDAITTNRWENLVHGIRQLDGFGGTGFMAKEVALDVILAGWKPSDEYTWTPWGPGGRRGLNRVMGRDKDAKISEQQMLEEGRELLKQVEANWPKECPQLGVTDIQFSLCEFDKYCRTRDGEGTPRSRYKPT